MSGRPSLRERLFSQLIIDPSGCLLWTGTIDKRGYGQIYIDGRCRKVHRVMYEMFAGAIPPGLQLDHVKAWGCTNRNCANVAHLEPVTLQENVRRGTGFVAANIAKTACPQGHEYDEENTRYGTDGARHCRACQREKARERYHQLANLRESAPWRSRPAGLHGVTKLTEADVSAIRERFAAGTATAAELAQIYGVDLGTIRRAASGKSWKHVPMDDEGGISPDAPEGAVA